MLLCPYDRVSWLIRLKMATFSAKFDRVRLSLLNFCAIATTNAVHSNSPPDTRHISTMIKPLSGRGFPNTAYIPLFLILAHLAPLTQLVEPRRED